MVNQIGSAVTPSTNDPRRDDLLERVVITRRSTLVNDGLAITRAGEDRPAEVVAALLERVERRIADAERYGDKLAAYEWTNALDALTRPRQQALAFGAWLIDWAAASAEERARVKAGRGEQHRRAYFEQQPPTPKQLEYLRGLGHTGEVRSKAHASELIDHLKQRWAS